MIKNDKFYKIDVMDRSYFFNMDGMRNQYKRLFPIDLDTFKGIVLSSHGKLEEVNQVPRIDEPIDIIIDCLKNEAKFLKEDIRNNNSIESKQQFMNNTGLLSNIQRFKESFDAFTPNRKDLYSYDQKFVKKALVTKYKEHPEDEGVTVILNNAEYESVSNEKIRKLELIDYSDFMDYTDAFRADINEDKRVLILSVNSDKEAWKDFNMSDNLDLAMLYALSYCDRNKDNLDFDLIKFNCNGDVYRDFAYEDRMFEFVVGPYSVDLGRAYMEFLEPNPKSLNRLKSLVRPNTSTMVNLSLIKDLDLPSRELMTNDPYSVSSKEFEGVCFGGLCMSDPKDIIEDEYGRVTLDLDGREYEYEGTRGILSDVGCIYELKDLNTERHVFFVSQNPYFNELADNYKYPRAMSDLERMLIDINVSEPSYELEDEEIEDPYDLEF